MIDGGRAQGSLERKEKRDPSSKAPYVIEGLFCATASRSTPFFHTKGNPKREDRGANP